MGWAIFKMLMALGIVLGILLVLFRLLKKTPWVPKDLPADFSIRVLTSKPIAPRKYISLVEIAGEVLALGVSEAQISLLTKIEHPDLLEKIRQAVPPGSGGPRSSWLNHLSWKQAELTRQGKDLGHGK